MDSFYSVIYILTGQSLSKSDYNKHYGDLIYKLFQRYTRRKKNKDIEEEWLQRQKVNL